jgi:hypothetical protein
LDSKYQNTILLNDIIDRNYYYHFKRSGDKDICLTFYTNNRYTNSNLIPGFPVVINDSEKILKNLDLFLKYYIENQFLCNIKINDDLWLTDIEIRDKIIDIFISNFKNSDYFPREVSISLNAIHLMNGHHEWFE